jgi:hypothetical protein
MRALCTWSYQPRNAQGIDLDRKYWARTDFELEFRDFGKMGAVTTQLLAMPNVSISNTRWRLTEKTKESLGSQSRKEAVQDAMAKARDFAEAAGCKDVRPFDIIDGYSSCDASQKGGLFGGSPFAQQRTVAPSAFGGFGSSAGFGTAENAQLAFAPEDIQLKADVTVKFHAE